MKKLHKQDWKFKCTARDIIEKWGEGEIENREKSKLGKMGRKIEKLEENW